MGVFYSNKLLTMGNCRFACQAYQKLHNSNMIQLFQIQTKGRGRGRESYSCSSLHYKYNNINLVNLYHTLEGKVSERGTLDSGRSALGSL